jgi:hypothetical protein
MRNWKSPLSIAVLFSIAALALIGCSDREAPVFGPENVPSATWSESELPYELVFVSRVYSDGQTTFTYQVTGVGEPCEECPGPFIAYPTDIMVELPGCAPAPVAYSPSDGVTIYTNVQGVYGIEWGIFYDDNPTFTYTITFDGDIAEGPVQGILRRASDVHAEAIAGPANRYVISGTVFTDTNADNIVSAIELGIPNATVTLDDGEGNLVYTTTDAGGHYQFSVCPGTYTVRLDETTEANDMNESLVADFEPTGPASYIVTVGPNSGGHVFGFEPDVDAIIEAIDNDEIPSEGKSYRFWRRQVFLALIGLDEFGQYTREELLAFIHQIEEIALVDEYDFTPGHELWQVFLILNNHADGPDDDGTVFQEDGSVTVASERTRGDDDPEFGGLHDPEVDAYKFLLRELLTSEFNHVSGRGLTTQPELLILLIQWGEGVLSENTPDSDLKVGDPQIIQNPLEDAGKVFKKVNGGATGGGGTGG